MLAGGTRMTLDQLRIFVAVAESLHVTRAAEDLGITQSGASAAIAALEARYGLELFHRIGRRIELTDAGHVFVPAAKAVLAQVAELQRELSELSSLRHGSLSLHASQTVANYWLPTHLAEFRRLYPGIQVRVKIGSSLQAAAAVTDGSADLGFADCRVAGPALELTELHGDKLVLLQPPGQQALRKKVRLVDLQEAPWVVRERGSSTRQAFDEAWRELDINPQRLNIALELPSNEAVLMAVESGIGPTVVSSLVAERSSLVPIDVGLKPRQFTVLRHRDRKVSRAQKAMLEIVHRKPPSSFQKATLQHSLHVP